MKPIKLNNEVRRKLSEKIDPALIMKREQYGGPDLSYISHNTCTDILNDAFGHSWSCRIVDRWTEPGYDQIIKKKKNWKTGATEWPKGTNPPPDQIKKDAQGNDYIVVPQGPTAWCIVEIEIEFEDENGKCHKIVKQGFGSSAFTGNQSTQSTNGFKGAQSDALKKAATSLGVALELYREPIEERKFQEMNKELFTPWTDELREIYSEHFEYINQICELNNHIHSIDDLAYWVSQATNGEYASFVSMDPSYMDDFIETLKAEEDLIHPEEE